MTVNSMKCIENIYSLAKVKKINIGDLEENVGLSKGYLARLKRDGGSFPPVEKLDAIAQQLGVTIHVLLSAELEESMTENQKVTYLFIDKVIRYTKSGDIQWNRVTFNPHDVDNYENELSEIQKNGFNIINNLFESYEPAEFYDFDYYRFSVYTAVLPGSNNGLTFCIGNSKYLSHAGDISHIHHAVLFIASDVVFESGKRRTNDPAIEKIWNCIVNLNLALNSDLYFEKDIKESMEEFLNYNLPER